MKISKSYKLKLVSGRQTIVADRRTVKDFNNVIILNETAVYIWNLLNESIKSKEEIVEKLMSDMKLSRLLALNSVDIFIKILRENKILEE